jgi:Na+/H+-translocating membrane pyrophosphatase
MQIKIVYPKTSKEAMQRNRMLKLIKWPFLLAAYLCPTLNLYFGGSAWSVIVLWALWMLWSLLLSPDLVEYNRISQTVKFIEYCCILMILIDVLLSQGWAADVVYIVCFSSLILTAILFFTDLNKQKQNMLPMLLLMAVSIAASIIGLTLWKGKIMWPALLAGLLAVALALACFSVLGKDFLVEFKKRFHTE